MSAERNTCPVTLCRNSKFWRHATCRSCWRRIPADLRQAIDDGVAARAPHREALAAIAAVNWLNAHPPSAAVARVCGERE